MSNRLFFDTLNLKYAAGLTQPTEIAPAAVRELMEAQQLHTFTVSNQGVIVMELKPEVFSQVAFRRKRKNPYKVDHIVVRGAKYTGASQPGSPFAHVRLSHVIAAPFNAGLLQKLLNAIAEALAAYQDDHRLVGTTVQLPGNLVPLQLSGSLPDNFKDLAAQFETAALNVLVDIEHGTLSFGTCVYGHWLGAERMPITAFLADAIGALKQKVPRNVIKLATELLKEPLFKERNVHQDEEAAAVVAAMQPNEEAEVIAPELSSEARE